jgi:hypothetical protein
VTVIAEPVETANPDAVKYPPAPPPPLPANPAVSPPPPPPPAITKYSTADTGAIGVILLLAALDGPVPWELVAVAVNVYAVPLDNPVTTIGDDAPVPVNPPGLEVMVYPVIALDPTYVGAVNVTEA